MEREPMSYPDKKKARMTKADEEGGNETINLGNISQGTQVPRPGMTTVDQNPQAVHSHQRGEEDVTGTVP